MPTELNVLRPDRMKVVPNDLGVVGSYEHTVNGNTIVWVNDFKTGRGLIWHLKDFHPLNDWYGMSAMEAAAYGIDQHNAASVHNAAFLQNSMRPAALFSWKSNPGDTERKRFENLLIERFEGPTKSGKPIVVGGDMTYKDIGSNMRDSDFIEGKREASREICHAFGIPSVLVVPGEATYKNRPDARIELWEQTIVPFAEDIKGALNSWLVPMFKDDSLSLDYDLNKISALIPRRAEKAKEARDNYKEGLITKDEARGQMGLAEVEDGTGDEFRARGSPPVGELPEGSKSGNPMEKKALTPINSLISADELDNPLIATQTKDVIDDMLTLMVAKFGKDVIEEIGSDTAFAVTNRVNEFISSHSADLIKNIDNTTKSEVRTALLAGFADNDTPDELVARIDKVFGFADDVRAKRIANTEATTAAGFGANEAMVQAGVSMKEWFTTFNNSRDTHIALDGTQVGTESNFISPSGDQAAYPGGFGSAAENINCNCGVAAVINEKSKSSRTQFIKNRERERMAIVGQIEPRIKKMFAIQHKAVLSRLRDIAG